MSSGAVLQLLADAADRASRYLSRLSHRRVSPSAEDVARLSRLRGALPEEPSDPAEVLALLDDVGSPAAVASAGGRYFGFVVGGSLPAALAASWLAGAWDQNAASRVMSPVAAALEDISLEWLRDLFQLPPTCAGAFVTGATMANFTSLLAARHALLARSGWNVEEDGLFGAPPISVVLGREAHISVLRALSLLGFGRARFIFVPADEQGRMIAEKAPPLDERTILCLQAGNVNSGAFDPGGEICARAREAGAWIHVDGAFGLWAAASPSRAHLMKGFGEADSWATDCHKWLNVPYDSGLAFVREPKHLREALAISAAYIPPASLREPWEFTPEMSRRARGVEIWAALRSLGKRGLSEMVDRTCEFAGLFAREMREAGYRVLNDVVLNQVLVSFGDAEITKRVISALQNDGTCWCGGTEWHGEAAMRISVSSWATTREDVERSVAAMLRIAREQSEKAAKR